MTYQTSKTLKGAGLGLRRSFLGEVLDGAPEPVVFWEVAPENWVDVGGIAGKRFRRATEKMPLVCHGLCLNLGGPAPLDEEYLRKVKKFIADHNVQYYGDHLSYSADDSHIYDLMPIPFTEEAVKHVVSRIRRTQDILGHRITVENPSYYCVPGKEMEEIDFINAIISEADCLLMFDINNVYVNSVNHAYDPYHFISQMPGERIAYAHIAGHYRQEEDLIVDTHGATVIDEVWKLLEYAYDTFGVFPTMIERDFNIPPLAELAKEVGIIAGIQARKDPLADQNRKLAHG